MDIGNRKWKVYYRRSGKEGCNRLRMLDSFPNSILVTGCQRSGTTVLTRLIAKSEGVQGVRLSDDDELDAAMILAGYVRCSPSGRYCFQTTFVNECYREYYKIGENTKLIFVLRNPYSVVRSMTSNWKHSALNILFSTCGAELMEGREARLYSTLGPYVINKTKKACLSYRSKTSQVFELKRNLPSEQMMVIDYDNLVLQCSRILPYIYEWAGIVYKEEYSNMMHAKNITKREKLTVRQKEMIDLYCSGIYEESLRLASIV